MPKAERPLKTPQLVVLLDRSIDHPDRLGTRHNIPSNRHNTILGIAQTALPCD